jgi:GTP-binding protein EngB required for normal cell division
MFKILQEHSNDILVVANKADVLNQKERSVQMKNIATKMSGIEIVPCSAKTGEGRMEILRKIFE